MNVLRFLAVLVWSFGVIGLSAYWMHGSGRLVEAAVVAVDSVLVAVGVMWYSRSWPKWPKRREARPPDHEALRGPARAIFDAEIAAGNTVEGSARGSNNGPVSVRLSRPFHLPHTALPRLERLGWEHYYENPDGTGEVSAIWRRSTLTAPVLCEHLRPLEIALHQAGFRLCGQFGKAEGWLAFECDLRAFLNDWNGMLPESVARREEKWQDRFDRLREDSVYCTACRAGIRGSSVPDL